MEELFGQYFGFYYHVVVCPALKNYCVPTTARVLFNLEVRLQILCAYFFTYIPNRVIALRFLLCSCRIILDKGNY